LKISIFTEQLYALQLYKTDSEENVVIEISFLNFYSNLVRRKIEAQSSM